MDNKPYNTSRLDSRPSTLVDGKSQHRKTQPMKLILTRVYMLWTLFLTLFVILTMLFVDRIRLLYRKVATGFHSHLSSLMQKQALEAHLTLMSLQETSSKQVLQQYTLKTNWPQRKSADTLAAKFLSLQVKLYAILMLLGLLLMLLESTL